jgi:hypothetical protein
MGEELQKSQNMNKDEHLKKWLEEAISEGYAFGDTEELQKFVDSGIDEIKKAVENIINDELLDKLGKFDKATFDKAFIFIRSVKGL